MLHRIHGHAAIFSAFILAYTMQTILALVCSDSQGEVIHTTYTPVFTSPEPRELTVLTLAASSRILTKSRTCITIGSQVVCTLYKHDFTLCVHAVAITQYNYCPSPHLDQQPL